MTNNNVMLIKDERLSNLKQAFEKGLGRDGGGPNFHDKIRAAVENDNSSFTIELYGVQFRKPTQAIDMEFLAQAFEATKVMTPVPLVGVSIGNYSSGWGSRLEFHIKESSAPMKLLNRLAGYKRVICSNDKCYY